MHRLFLLAALLFPSGHQTEGPFLDLTYAAACTQAAASKRAVFIDFYTDWCSSCKRMDEETWMDSTVMAWLGEHTVAIKVNAEKEVQLAESFGVTAYPTLLFIDPSGELQGQLLGFRRAQQFIREGKLILAGEARSSKLRSALREQPGNPHLKMALARELAKELNPVEAFELFLWCFDHGLEDPSFEFETVRLTVLLKQIKSLANQYPQVEKIMITRASAARDVLMGPLPTLQAVKELVALNNTFGQKWWSLDVYDNLIAKQSQLDLFARESPEDVRDVYNPLPAMFERVLDQLIAARRYPDVLRGFGDPRAWAEAQLGEMANEQAKDTPDKKRQAKLKRNYERRSAWLYEALLGSGEHDDQAAQMKDRLLTQKPRAVTWNRLMKHARLAGREQVQRQLREEALATLPKKEHGRLRKLAD